jgi:hypothetical protein
MVYGHPKKELDQQNVNQNYINTLVTDILQVLLDSAKQTFGVKSVNTNYSKKKKIAKRDKPWFNIDCKLARQNYRKMKRKKGESQFAYNLLDISFCVIFLLILSFNKLTLFCSSF